MDETHPIMKLFEQEEQRRADLNQLHEAAELLLQRIKEALRQERGPLSSEDIADLAQALYHYWEIRQGLESQPGMWKNGK